MAIVCWHISTVIPEMVLSNAAVVHDTGFQKRLEDAGIHRSPDFQP